MNPSLARLISQGFGLGLLPKAPGTWASAAAIPVGYLLHRIGGFPLFGAVAVLTAVVGWIAVRSYLQTSADPDPSEVVVDEIVGQWIPLAAVSYGLWAHGVTSFPWPGWVCAFLFFRLFDIWKPGPVGWADRKPGATGVMLDDVIAGLLAAVVTMAAAGFYHGVLGR
ncbi:phosphatidylglycerophosphatase A family protein [Neomegalonema perideroedes]|uniref:phosphatidylglycerophosphatase A family protein n=1 Tax=Neomegalonema perideroedes TaxID=217219 RepID=UPI0003703CAF|nr:phosphatidylglycerophosphatase A [Neomegalonema perideroedes]